MPDADKYQRHIDGLRAVAVLSVIFYHFRLDLFPGGFVGVDVFFVISGYLITRLILDEIDQTGNFSFQRFYIRRMRRLFPAMAVTFAASTLAALWLFSPSSLQAYGRSLAAAVFSVSNVLFWTESGYFDMGSHLKPLLHTWSLGVEEQFYLIWPALLWFCARRPSTALRVGVLAAVGLLSLGLNVLWVHGGFDADYASSIFFLTPFRMFELVMGALAIFIAPLLAGRRRLQEAGMLLGLSMIAWSVLTFHGEIPFPYLPALVPCAGALLVILCREASAVGGLLTNPVAVGVGLISYSMYLVHWPLLVFYEYYTMVPVGLVEAAALFTVTAALSTVMYFAVEKTLRKRSPTGPRPPPQRAFVLSMGGIMVLIAFLGLSIHATGGQTWRNGTAPSQETVSAWERGRFQLVRRGCNLQRLDRPGHCHLERPFQVLVIGNSHEPDGYNAFHRIYGENPQVNLISFGTLNRCDMEVTAVGPVSEVDLRQCRERVALLNDPGFVSRLDAVVYSASRPFLAKRRESWRLLEHLQGMNPDIRLVVLGGYLNTVYACPELAHRFGSYDHCREPAHLAYDPFGERPRAEVDTAALDYLYIDKTSLLCPGGSLSSCAMRVGDVPAFYDEHHLTFPFAQMLGERIAEHYGAQLNALGFPAPEGAPGE